MERGDDLKESVKLGAVTLISSPRCALQPSNTCPGLNGEKKMLAVHLNKREENHF